MVIALGILLLVQQSGHGGFRDGNLEIINGSTLMVQVNQLWQHSQYQAPESGICNRNECSTSNGGGAVGVDVYAISQTAVGGGSGNRLGELNSFSWVFSLNLFDARHRHYRIILTIVGDGFDDTWHYWNCC